MSDIPHDQAYMPKPVRIAGFIAISSVLAIAAAAMLISAYYVFEDVWMRLMS